MKMSTWRGDRFPARAAGKREQNGRNLLVGWVNLLVRFFKRQGDKAKLPAIDHLSLGRWKFVRFDRLSH